MKLMILGGSSAQEIAIKKAQELGIEVIVCDYNEEAIGHKSADVSSFISSFDANGAYKFGKQMNIDGVMTLGTDQPILTVAYVAKQLGLPMLINYDTALYVTNKWYMKKTFSKHLIPTTDYVFYKKGVNENCLDEIGYPVVVKPIDSQGQRGVYYLENKSSVIEKFEAVICHSRDSKILVETYYENDEITVSGWVQEERLTILSITDRVTFYEKNRIGICLAHTFPSKHLGAFGSEIVGLSKQIVEDFNIQNGPIYFQLLIGEEGIKVNEIACRIGGAYEATVIPLLTGFDICEATIKASLGLNYISDSLKDYRVLGNSMHISVQLFFVSSCRIAYMPTSREILELEGVTEVGFNVKVGDLIGQLENATSRAGYVVLQGRDQEQLNQMKHELYNKLVILDKAGNNHIIHESLRGDDY